MIKIFSQKQIRLILILSIVASLLLGVKLFFASKKTPHVIVPLSPTPKQVLTPVLIPTLFLPKGDLDAPIRIREEINRDYPLFEFIPHKALFWQADYLKPLTLEVILKIDTLETRQEVIDWIKSKKVDPSTHQIIWKTLP